MFRKSVHTISRMWVVLILFLALGSFDAFDSVPANPARAQEQASLRERMLLAEDARAQTDAELTALRQGLTSRDPTLRRQAVRAIGRLERPDLIPALTRLLADGNAD